MPDQEFKGTILVADDESVVRNLIVRIFKRHNVRVLDAEDGYACIDLFTQEQEEIDVVILDMSMPGLNGLETMQRLRDIRSDVPIILSSGYDEHTLGNIADEITVFVRKPYRPQDLYNAASTWFIEPTV